MAQGGEATILGGLKTKSVDVVVIKDRIGPALAVSCKGMTGALRNLTNRMEETIGETTNLHITYPALVFGYLFLLRAHQEAKRAADSASDAETVGRALKRNDLALKHAGDPVEGLMRFEYALRGMSGRRLIRNDIARYESICLVLIDPKESPGNVLAEFPTPQSGLRINEFFETLYTRYDERFVITAPKLAKGTRRLVWQEASPAFDGPLLDELGYAPRLA